MGKDVKPRARESEYNCTCDKYWFFFTHYSPTIPDCTSLERTIEGWAENLGQDWYYSHFLVSLVIASSPCKKERWDDQSLCGLSHIECCYNTRPVWDASHWWHHWSTGGGNFFVNPDDVEKTAFRTPMGHSMSNHRGHYTTHFRLFPASNHGKIRTYIYRSNPRFKLSMWSGTPFFINSKNWSFQALDAHALPSLSAHISLKLM